MNKTKHSKYKNTGLLFEFMTRQLTEDVLNERESKMTSILQKYFSSGTELSKEYNLYRKLMGATPLSETRAKILVDNVIDSYNGINKKKLDKEKYNLVKDIKENFDIQDLLKTKIPNYKLIASINHILENGYSNEVSTEHLYVILDHLIQSKDKKDIIMNEFINKSYEDRKRILDIFINKFNDKFSTLSENQRKILSDYISNISSDKNFHISINESIGQLKDDIISIKSKLDSNNTYIYKLDEVIVILDEISNVNSIKDNHIATLLYINELVNTFKDK